MPATKASRTSSSKAKPESNGHVHGPHCNHDHGHGHDHGMLCELAIRRYQASDFKGLTAAWKSGDIGLDDSDTAKSIERNLKERPGSYRVFVAEAQMVDTQKKEKVGKARIAGGVITTFDGHRAYVYHLAVHRDFRGVGLGKALLETCEEQAHMWGARHLRLSARLDESRDAARKMYEENGWAKDDSICIYRKTLDK
jgi:GNAT superfamily N-acetyltransferase